MVSREIAETLGVVFVVLPVFLAFTWLAVVSVVLAIIDVHTHRLPDRIVLPGYPIGVALLGCSAAASGDLSRLGRALLAAVLVFAFFLLLRVLSHAGMGGGDVKLAGVLGLFLGWVGWDAVALGVFSAFVLGGVHGVVVLVRARRRRAGGVRGRRKAGGRLAPVPVGEITVGQRAAIAFGPWMLAGSWIGMAAAFLLPLLRTAG